jgi:hypothetical protein
MEFSDADREPTSHRVSDHMGTFTSDGVKHRNYVAGAFLLTIQTGIERPIAQPMAKRIDARDPKPVSQSFDNAAVVPACTVQQ